MDLKMNASSFTVISSFQPFIKNYYNTIICKFLFKMINITNKAIDFSKHYKHTPLGWVLMNINNNEEMVSL